MEYALYDERVLRFAYRSDDTGGDFRRIGDARRVFQVQFQRVWVFCNVQAIELQQQVIHALFDLRAHNCGTHSIDVDKLSHAYGALERHYLPDIRTPNASTVFWPNRFGHLVPYGGRYSAYLVARACAGLVWTRLFERDPMSPAAGAQWRRALGWMI